MASGSVARPGALMKAWKICHVECLLILFSQEGVLSGLSLFFTVHKSTLHATENQLRKASPPKILLHHHRQDARSDTTENNGVAADGRGKCDGSFM